VAEGVENEGGKEEVEDEAGGREEVELDDECRSRIWAPSKDELRGELMAAIASDPSGDNCWEVYVGDQAVHEESTCRERDGYSNWDGRGKIVAKVMQWL
jgi:hypothetical protein